MSTHATDNYQFTESQDWFSQNIEHWTRLFSLVESRNPRALEIGSWEGRSAIFTLNNLCRDGGEIICIDHFDLFRTDAGKERFTKINHNLSATGKQFRILSEFSFPALMKLLVEEMSSSNPGFDWIYVDGSHEADDTMLDGELAWRLARKRAIVTFDDYHWNKEAEDSIHHPRRGIDAFLSLHDGQYECLSTPLQYQVVIRKLTPMRIGFLVPEVGRDSLDEFGYGMNIVLAIDSPYAMPAAVVICSIIENTPGRITIYIIDCGLSETDKTQLKSSTPIERGDEVTLMLVGLKEDSIVTEMGVPWAKLEIHKLVPVERILYLDADILVRSDLKELWRADLKGKSIAAVTDIGYPMGHGGVERGPYFNAGVMLMDLTKVRVKGSKLEDCGRKMKDARFRDQDALNMHFRDDWFSLNLRWNAQGLGTYATYPSPDRELLNLEDMDNPSIVHFTGPVNPNLVEILNPWVQPPTAKPWGYVRAPSHPFQQEWWGWLEKTPWRGCRIQETMNTKLLEERQRAITEAVTEFDKRVTILNAALHGQVGKLQCTK